MYIFVNNLIVSLTRIEIAGWEWGFYSWILSNLRQVFQIEAVKIKNKFARIRLMIAGLNFSL